LGNIFKIPGWRYRLKSCNTLFYRQIWFVIKFPALFILFIWHNDAYGQTLKLVLPTGQTNGIRAMGVSADEKRIYARDFTNSYLRVWDAASGFKLTEILGSGFEMSPDRKYFITSPNDSLCLWDANKTVPIKKVKSATGIVYYIAFSNDGNKIATVSGDNIVTIRNSKTLVIINEWVSQGSLSSITFSGDDEQVLSNLKNRSFCMYDVATGKELVCISSILQSNLKDLHMPKGQYKLIVVEEPNVYISDLRKGELHKQGGYRAGFSENNEFIFIATPETGIKKINIQTGKNVLTIRSGKYNYINKIVTAPGGRILGTCSANQTVDLWDINTGKQLYSYGGFTDGVKFLSFSRDGSKVYAASNNEIKIWKIDRGDQLLTIKKHTSIPWSATAHPSAPKIVIAQNDSLAKIWNLLTGQPELTLGKHTEGVEYAEFSPDGKKIITVADSTAFIWDAETGKQLQLLKDEDMVYSAHFSGDNANVLTAGYHHVTIWNLQKSTKVSRLKGLKGLIENAVFSADGQSVVTGSQDSLVVWWDVNTGEIKKGVIMNQKVNYVSQHPDQTTVAYALSDHTVKLMDTETRVIKKTLTGHKWDIGYITYNKNGDKILTASFDDNAILWNTGTGEKISTFYCGSTVYTAVFTNDESKVVTCSEDNIIRLWNAEDGRLINSFFSVDSTGYLNIIPAGYYFGTVETSKLLHYVTKDLKSISFEQLDVKYNRPDKVLEAMGNTDTALIKSYRKAYEKRIKKLGIDTTSFRDGYSVPESDFVNRDAIEYEQKTGILKLVIKGNDSTYKLDRFNIWVNETPVFGQRGISIRRRNKNDFDTTITIKLSQGENKIETSITNVNGTESYRMPLVVNYTPAVKQKETIRFIGIGIDRFSDYQYNLQYSSKDIRDLSKKLKEKYREDIIIDTLFNEDVTVNNVKALKQKLQQTTENDKVIIAYSGHGMLGKDYDYYLSTYAVNFNNPEENGLSYDELESLLDSIPARKKLMLIDACHSGEVDKEDLITLNASSDSLIKGLKPVAYKKEGHLGLKNSFELMQSLFVNVGKSTGATIISAAAGTQFALERNDLKNGVFTYSILEAMNKYPTLKISELKKIVGERVEQLTKGLQKPTSRNETIAVDWRVW
jgi:WD40 repeat protein